MVSEKSRTNLDDQPEKVENPSLRKNLKRLAAFFVVAALGTFSVESQAQENSGDNEELPELSKEELKRLNGIAKENKLSQERLKKLRETVKEMLKHDEYSVSHPNAKHKLQNGGFARTESDGTMVSSRGIKLALTREQNSEIMRVASGHTSSRDSFYRSELPKHFEGKELREVEKAYENIMDQMRIALRMDNSRDLFNHEREDEEVSDFNKVRSSYNRVVAMGILKGWSPEEFKVALEEILPEEFKKQGLRLKDIWGRDGTYPTKLLKEDNNGVDYESFYDKGKQQGNLSNLKEDLNDPEIHEAGYDGGKGPLERARDLYPNDEIKQIIYTFNIYIADQLRLVQEGLINSETKELNSGFSQFLSNGIAGTFSPKHEARQ